ncbi:MAG: ABC transporter substrate-binding protein [Anaerolineae bacterium]|nr:ABC transporter substrate-binding protein [Anaerolineae bacterium]
MKKIWFVVLITLLASLAGCNGNATPTPTPQPAEDVIFQLSWTHEYSSSGLYMAVENGHFAGQNLNVNIVAGGFGDEGYIEPIDEVLNGESAFGTSSSTSIIQAQAEGKAVVGIATILQRNPLAIISFKENNIVNPADLAGKTIAVSDGAARTRVLTFLAQQGVDADSVTLIPRTTFGIEPLLNGEAQLLAGWIINEGVMVEEAGYEANIMLLSDYALEDYSFIIFTSQEMIDTRPDLVERFLRGFVGGMNDTIGNPSQAVKAVLKYDNTLDEAQQLTRLEVMLPLINPPGEPLGEMDMVVWEQSQDVLIEQGVLTAPIDLNKAFTNQFLEKINGGQ